jgi:cytochrome c oxidase subunit 3
VDEEERDIDTFGMWTFLVTEVLFFGGLFLGYAYYRAAYPAAFEAGSRHLDLELGTFNTVVLIASSFSMAMAGYTADKGQRRWTLAALMATMTLGALFLGIKFTEYAHKFKEGLVPGFSFSYRHVPILETQLFFSFYFVMTGLHAVHMLAGISVLGFLALSAWRARADPLPARSVEVIGLYWHFVDIVWIFLFPLLYLLGTHK